jgi:hypothetical protein
MALIFNNPSALSELFGTQYNMMSTLPIDVTISESHNLKQRVTDKPVEGGAIISDNIILLPTTIKINGVLQGDFFSGLTLTDKFNALKELRKSREPFTLTTSLDVYENMFFDGEITIDRDASNSKAIVFTATLKQINIIESLTKQVPAKSVAQSQDAKGKRSRAPKTDSGKKTAVDSKTEARDKSWIVGLIG